MKKIILLCFFLFSCSADYLDNIQDGYVYFSEGSDANVISGNKLVISCNVIGYSNGSNYILAAQKPDRRCHSDDLRVKNIKDVDVIQFWIIETKKHKMYGPLKLSDFLKKREELGVPKTIKLKIEL